MRPILSATHTYSYALAKWLDEKLKPLSYNQYTVTDTFQFVNEIQGIALFTVTFFICITMYLNVDVRQFRAKSAKLPEIASHPR